MIPIIYQETVTEKGLYLNGPELLKFINQKVEITIAPIILEEEEKADWRQLIGKWKGRGISYKEFMEERQRDRELEIKRDEKRYSSI